MDNLQFGAFVAQLRKERNMTQKELADALHVTDKAVSKWETGKGFPDVKLLEPLARALGVSLVELMRGERLEADALPVAEAEQVVSQAMDRSQRTTARRYLKLLSALLIGIGVLCLLRLIPIIGFLIYLGQLGVRTKSWTSHTAHPRRCLYSIGLSPPNDSLIRLQLYQLI